MAAIYVSMDCSQEWDDFYATPVLEYVGTDKEAAVKWFQIHRDTAGMSDEKWHYRYELWEYPDGWSKFSAAPPLLLMAEDNHPSDD